MIDPMDEAYAQLCERQAEYNELLDLDTDDPRRIADLATARERFKHARQRYWDLVATQENEATA